MCKKLSVSSSRPQVLMIALIMAGVAGFSGPVHAQAPASNQSTDEAPSVLPAPANADVFEKSRRTKANLNDRARFMDTAGSSCWTFWYGQPSLLISTS